MDPLLLVVAVIPALLLVVAMFLLARRASDAGAAEGAWREAAEYLTQTRMELRSLGERVLRLEELQNRVQGGIAGLDRTLAQTDVATRTLMEATGAIRQELSQAKQDLVSLQAQARARHDMEAQVATSIRRLEAILAGTQSKGAAGENVLEALFGRLPAEWQARNFRVGSRVVEFALRLPNNLVLPIDSKWPATELLERFAQCEDPEEQLQLKREVESVVLAKAQEVRKYLDPSTTVDFGVAAVPDAVYDLCSGIQADLFQMNVVLVSYGMFVPYLLLVFQTVLKTSQEIDVERLLSYVSSAQESTRLLQEELEGRFARALAMLSNSRNDMAVQVSRISSWLTSLCVAAPDGGETRRGGEGETG
ncbi:MAG: DNA recombination protein RmuC [Anaerolineae bacterium]|nr:DNA recombination protein RmuC [Anaerolineae bacterium]